ncbi:c-type cytochrome [Methylogaea oryzae]|uniref:Cytochrome c n=1 Tax=Methylogaea oryzae TaxID=1295382 RepID=A0A8D4VR12_9GAMM|nr:cytochrome c [Methylogaea oryzae]BBL72530.1 cytochrome c [Methylogaea oryzae]
MKHKILGTLTAAALGFAAAHNVQAAGNAEAGKAKFHTCVGCHGIPGYSNTFPNYHVPSLGGQHAEYIVSALKSYAASGRKHGSMNGNAGGISERDMEDVAAYASAFKGKPPAVSVKGDVAAGKKNPNLEVCASCHGSDGNSKDGGNPRLAGQYESFLIKAMKDYQSGARKNPIMQGMVKDLTDKDIADLAAYFASQKKGLTPVSN